MFLTVGLRLRNGIAQLVAGAKLRWPNAPSSGTCVVYGYQCPPPQDHLPSEHGAALHGYSGAGSKDYQETPYGVTLRGHGGYSRWIPRVRGLPRNRPFHWSDALGLANVANVRCRLRRPSSTLRTTVSAPASRRTDRSRRCTASS